MTQHTATAPATNHKDHAPRYHLRFQILPGTEVRRDAKVLAEHCVRHRVEEVVLFFAAEEWNNGLLSRKDENVWFRTVREAKKVLEAHGISVSLNPWMTVLHSGCGRHFPADRKFRPMVSPSGEVSKACASFADPAWQKYLCNLYGRFASLGFRVIWVEDDFRYHNHSPLDWGGGFEPGMLKRFSKKAGRLVSREALVKALLKPGSPHPWRALWMETWRETQLEAARALAASVAASAPGATKIGLMTSHPALHSTEGRKWDHFFEAFTLDGQVVHRPHFQHYREVTGPEVSYSFAMMDIQKDFRPPASEVAPEIENAYFTSWNKSDSLTWAHMTIAQLFGSDALLLDLFPFSGNSASTEPAVWSLLDRCRPALEWVGSRFSKNLETQGVGIPWRQDAQTRIRTSEGKSFQELYLEPDVMGHRASDFLMRYGVAVSLRQQTTNAVFGRLAWVFSDEEWRDLLKGGLLLDATSVEILCQRGFAKDVGVDFLGMAGREDDSYSLERVVSKECGVSPGFYSNMNIPQIGKLRLRKGAKEWTEILRPDGSRVGAGTVAFENRQGGRVVTFAAADPNALARSNQRQAMVHSAVRFAAGRRAVPVLVAGGPYLMVEAFAKEGKRFVTVFNGSPDANRPLVRLHSDRPRKIAATLLKPLEKPAAACVSVTRARNGVATVTSLTPLPYLGFLVLEMET